MFFSSLPKSLLLQTLPSSPPSKPSKTLISSSSPFLNGSLSLSLPIKTPKPSFLSAQPLSIQAMKKLQGRVVCATSDKTVAVEVVRLAPHPKYKRRVRKKKKYQAHDPDNQFKVGDFVQLEKSRPISKTKTFVAIPVAARNAPKTPEPVPQELSIPLQSQQQQSA